MQKAPDKNEKKSTPKKIVEGETKTDLRYEEVFALTTSMLIMKGQCKGEKPER